ncbi:MAG: tol-pal system protein YbgF [bacterium]
MSANKKALLTAVLSMAVLYLVQMLSGCCTPRMINEIKAQVQQVEMQNRQTQQAVAHIDSVLTEDTEANKQLRNEMSVTIQDLQQRIETLLENYSDLMQRIEKFGQQQSAPAVIRSSPGVRQEPGQPVEESVSVDCDKKYDDAFILVRRGEYDQAIEGFREFLSLCEKHDLVENAFYWVGECYYSLEKYDQAVTEFQYLITNYKSSVNASRALYKLGRSQQELGKKSEAIRIFQQLVDDHPGTLEAEQARERLKDLK